MLSLIEVGLPLDRYIRLKIDTVTEAWRLVVFVDIPCFILGHLVGRQEINRLFDVARVEALVKGLVELVHLLDPLYCHIAHIGVIKL